MHLDFIIITKTKINILQILEYSILPSPSELSFSILRIEEIRLILLSYRYIQYIEYTTFQLLILEMFSSVVYKL